VVHNGARTGAAAGRQPWLRKIEAGNRPKTGRNTCGQRRIAKPPGGPLFRLPGPEFTVGEPPNGPPIHLSCIP